MAAAAAVSSGPAEEQEEGEGEGEGEYMEEGEEEEQEFLPGYPTLQDYSKALLGEVVKATKVANSLPEEGDDFDYYSSFPGFRTFCSKIGSRVTRSIGRVIRQQSLPCYWPPPFLAPPTETQREEAGLVAMVEERMEAIIDSNDILLERVGVLMDEACGLRRKEEAVLPPKLQKGTAEVASWNKKKKKKGKLLFMASRNVPRPQVRFRDQVDNSKAVFVPRLRSKPNARQPLPDVYQRLQEPQSLNSLISNSKEWALVKDSYVHPYQFELKNFVPIDAQLQISEPQAPGSLEEVPYQFIREEAEFERLVTELSQCAEFAVDLENHFYRSYQGFVCLMQISTRSHDYIIDTIELRHAMHRLLDPFTNPNIVKVLHGADFDIPWLQRDFGLYVVNLFDTGKASHVLDLPRHSLAFLLHYCCGVEADKQYQLADWRIRPLPAEMERYAREDTHYLLYIYDRMRNELIRRKKGSVDPLLTTLERSRDVCLRTYQKPLSRDQDYLKLYNKHKLSFNSQQLHCLKLLFQWRDTVGRDEDESTGYVLPSHMMFQISEKLPRDPQGVLACCTPVPTLLRQQLQEVFLMVQEARETPLTQQLPRLTQLPATKVATPTATPTPLSLPSHPHHTPSPITTLHSEPLAGSQRSSHLIQLLGPPVLPAPSSLSAIEEVSLELSGRVREQLKEIRESFPDILDKFIPVNSSLDPQPPPPPTATTPAPAASPAAAAAAGSVGSLVPVGSAGRGDGVTGSGTSPTVSAGTSEDAGSSTAVGGGGGGGKKANKKRKQLSVREMGASKCRKVSPPTPAGEEEKEEEEKQTKKKKKIKLSDKDDQFTPFDYDGANFTDFTQGSSQPPAVMFQPNSDGPGGGRGGVARQKGGVARQRVQMKSGERSLTHRGQASAQRLWPK